MSSPSRSQLVSLVVLATADLMGETSTCGCHTPKGGFARIGTFVDNTRATGQATLYVDAGGAFPVNVGRTDLARFMFQENAAHEAVASRRSRGARVIVLLSQLGRVGGEDLASS